MNRKQLQQWEKSREKGMMHFLLLRGVLAWGLPMFITMTFIVGKTSFDDFEKILFSLVLWGIGGLVFGFWTWKYMEIRYSKIRSESQEEA